MKKRVLFFNPCLRGGGAEKVLINLLNNLDKTKYDITLITIFGEGINRKFLASDVRHIYKFKKVFRGNVFLMKLFSPQFLYKFFIKDKYDVIVAYQEGPSTRILSGCPDRSVKKIAWLHVELAKLTDYSSVYRSLQEMYHVYNQYHAVVGVSDTIVDSFKKFTRFENLNYYTIYNTNLTKHILRLAQEQQDVIVANNNLINLITVGRLTAQKGFDRLLSVIYRLQNIRNITHFHLYILGIGELEQQHKQFVAQKKIDHLVSFLGYDINPYKYIINADLFVCSSYKEGFSTAVSESLIVGTPVITTDCSGMREMLGNSEFGVIVDNNEDSLFYGLLDLLQDKNKIFSYKKQAQLRSSFFSTDQRVRDVEDLIDSDI